MQDQINSILDEAKTHINKAAELVDVERLRVQYLGKKGALTELLKSVSQQPVADRPKFGKAVNEAKRAVQALLVAQEAKLQELELAQRLQAEQVDVSLPGRRQSIGSLHPVTRVQQRVTDLFATMGFRVATGPEVEDEYHNFEALNIPAYHPARNAQDTFYFADGHLLRTHTSPVQIRVMKEQGPPIRIITPGRVYRRDSDQTHTPMFHQLEGLVVDTHCTFAELKGLLQEFFNQFFEKSTPLRFRPSYFPFTEPSAEVDIQHDLCQGAGCRVCGHTGWLEVLGCGMVHPNVLNNVNINPDHYSGFAFGLGLDRMAMLRYGVDDLRLFFDNDLRFLQQF